MTTQDVRLWFRNHSKPETSAIYKKVTGQHAAKLNKRWTRTTGAAELWAAANKSAVRAAVAAAAPDAAEQVAADDDDVDDEPSEKTARGQKAIGIRKTVVTKLFLALSEEERAEWQAAAKTARAEAHAFAATPAAISA
jgi:hypothetical protein